MKRVKSKRSGKRFTINTKSSYKISSNVALIGSERSRIDILLKRRSSRHSSFPRYLSMAIKLSSMKNGARFRHSGHREKIAITKRTFCTISRVPYSMIKGSVLKRACMRLLLHIVKKELRKCESKKQSSWNCIW